MASYINSIVFFTIRYYYTTERYNIWIHCTETISMRFWRDRISRFIEKWNSWFCLSFLCPLIDSFFVMTFIMPIMCWYNFFFLSSFWYRFIIRFWFIFTKKWIFIHFESTIITVWASLSCCLYDTASGTITRSWFYSSIVTICIWPSGNDSNMICSSLCTYQEITRFSIFLTCKLRPLSKSWRRGIKSFRKTT